jgi:DNA integrity scanning protein DisA with diadenylate cyclase activity
MAGEIVMFDDREIAEALSLYMTRSFEFFLSNMSKGYKPPVQLDTVFASEEGITYFYCDDTEVFYRDFDFNEREEITQLESQKQPEEEKTEKCLKIINSILQKWEKEKDWNHKPICDAQYIGVIKKQDIFVVPASPRKDVWKNTDIINNVYLSFIEEWRRLLDDELIYYLFKSKKQEEVNRLFDPQKTIRTECQKKLLDIFENDKIFDFLAKLSIQPYESGANHGTLAVIDREQEFDIVKFLTAIPLSNINVRQIRKLLEMSCDGWEVIVKDSEVVGLGKGIPVRGRIEFVKPGCWNVIDKEILFSVEANDCYFVVAPGDIPYKQSYRECFNNSHGWAKIEGIINAAVTQKHGTTIVVSDIAKTEAKRLCEKGFGVFVDEFSATDNLDVIKAISSIDGAVMMDKNGMVYGIGVILDGTAKVSGNPGRGARYNSIRNYLARKDYKTGKQKCMAVVISEDGTADTITSIGVNKESEEA